MLTKEMLLTVLDESKIKVENKEIIANDAMEIYDQVYHEIKNASTYDRAKVVIKLSCDKHSCAINIKPRSKYLCPARKKSGIAAITDGRDRIPAIVKIITNNMYVPDEIVTEIMDKAINVLTVFYADTPSTVRSPFSLAVSAVYLSSILSNYRITQSKLSELFNVDAPTIRACYMLIAQSNTGSHGAVIL